MVRMTARFENMDAVQRALQQYGKATMREQISRMKRSLGALENEVRRREGEFIAMRASVWLDDNE